MRVLILVLCLMFQAVGTAAAEEQKHVLHGTGLIYQIRPVYIDGETRNGMVVTYIHPGSIAEKAGFETGDRIVELNGSAMGGSSMDMWSAYGFRKRIYQSAKPSIQFKVRRSGEEIPIALSYPYSLEMDSHKEIPIFRIRRFGSHAKALMRRIQTNEKLQETHDKPGMPFVLDLRSNSNGESDKFASVIAGFMPYGQTVLGPFYEGGEPMIVRDSSSLREADLYLLVDENTRGWAVVMAAALRELRGAKVIGRFNDSREFLLTVGDDGFGQDQIRYGLKPEFIKIGGTTAYDPVIEPDYPIQPDANNPDAPYLEVLDRISG